MDNQDNKLPTKSENNKQDANKPDQEIIDQVNRMKIPEKQKHDIIATMEMYSGPIPHPKILAGYQALYPDAAKKIIDNGIAESEHRRHMENARQRRRGHLAWASMILLFIFCILFILGSFYLIMNGHKIIGSIFGGSSFVVLAGSFLNNIDELSKNDDISTNNQEKQEKSVK